MAVAQKKYLIRRQDSGPKCRRGRRGSCSRTIGSGLPRVKKTARYLSGSTADSEEIVLNTLVEIVKSAGHFKGESTLLNYWADRITVFTASKCIDKSCRRAEIRKRTWVPGKEVVSAEEQIDMERMRIRLSEHLRTLAKNQRVPLVLHYLHGYKVDEIAELTKTKRNTVRGRLRGGMVQIRKQVLEDPLLRQWILGRY